MLTVVIATRNRREELLPTLERAAGLPEQPKILVVDNGSSDGTPSAARERLRELERPGLNAAVLPLHRNQGAAARNVGVANAHTPYVAFCDDDSWWEPGALAHAVELLDAHPRLALLAGRVQVGREGRLDEVCAAMRASPLHDDTAHPGVPVLGFLACAAVVRRDAFLAVGGFHAKLGIGGEEQLLAVDLSAAGWQVRYVDELLVHHHPSQQRDLDRRRAVMVRNALWFSWLRRRPLSAVAATGRAFAGAITDTHQRAGVIEALRGLRWVLRSRRQLPGPIEAHLRLLERAG